MGMRLFTGLLCAALAADIGQAETLVAARTLPAQTVLSDTDIRVGATPVAGALRRPMDAIGLETRTVIYEGRPLRPADIGPAAVVERNEIITLSFAGYHLEIATDGRALDRGATGDRVRVMNLASRKTVTATITGPGMAQVTR